MRHDFQKYIGKYILDAQAAKAPYWPRMENPYGGGKEYWLCLAVIAALEIRLPINNRMANGIKNDPPIRHIAFSWPVISAVALLLIAIGFGVLSMTPPESKIAIWLFSGGFILLLIKLWAWIIFERAESAFATAGLLAGVSAAVVFFWYLCFAFASTKAPHNGPSVLSFDCMYVDIGNMPERKSVTNTWDGKPWDERWADIRLNIHGAAGVRVNNIDFTIAPENRTDTAYRYEIEAIDQLSKIGGVEFPKPPSPQINFRIQGDDQQSHNLPMSMESLPGWGTIGQASIKVYASRVEGETLRLILGISKDTQNRHSQWIVVDGSYQVFGAYQLTTVHKRLEVKD